MNDRSACGSTFFDVDRSFGLSEQGGTFGYTSLEEFIHAWQALCNIPLSIGNPTRVKGPHRQLGARLANALSGNDADCNSLLDQPACGEILAIAVAADPIVSLTSERRTDSQSRNSRSKQTSRMLIVQDDPRFQSS